ncbi:alpha-1,2-fucosyltransferase [Aquabacterium sp.]|uniref:alpha-1,2-fucosyltransferase n=1 Tax=Aquabacterium sp. TaxID=1872578 RepID=UPI0019CA442D|nr:alpha-1,2-fucosyltransferase [Aquabacterium sp.]MBC7700862.1 alpha-1,2-fucosyltransferase [Aquabacterium sp.]
MIHVRLAGGLGNQLFQLAAAALVDPTGQACIIPHAAALGRYSAARQPDSLRLLSGSFGSPKSDSPWQKAWNWLIESGRAGRWLMGIGIGDLASIQNLSFGSRCNVAILDGYFQKGWTDARMADAIARLCPLKPLAHASSRVEIDECVVHIRGGDFLKLPAYQVATDLYYRSAIQKAKKTGYNRFAVITDDQEYAKRFLEKLSEELSEGMVRIVDSSADALSDFDALRAASARIISNSTFAWWAAALDLKKSHTWSPTQFTRDEIRDYFLPWEIPIASAGLLNS